MTEAKRIAELWLCGKLTAATDITFSANHGGSDATDDAEAVVGSCGVVQVTECVAIFTGRSVFQAVAIIGYMSHMGETTAEQHGANARKVQDAILALGPDYDAELGIRVHGVDMRQTDDFTDEDMRTRGDAFTVAMGISV